MKPKPNNPAIHRPLKPFEAYAARKRPPQGKSGEKAEMAQFARKWAEQELCMETWQREIEADEAQKACGWYDSGKGFFERLRGRVG